MSLGPLYVLLGEVSVQVFAHFLIGLFAFLMLSCSINSIIIVVCSNNSIINNNIVLYSIVLYSDNSIM